MIQLQKYIATYLSTLFDEYGFIVKESKNSGNRFYGASILMTSNEVEIFLAIERDEIVIYLRSLFDKRKNNWYSIEVVLSLLGHQYCLGIMTDSNSVLLRDGIPEIIRCFSESNCSETLNKLDAIKKKRSKRRGRK